MASFLTLPQELRNQIIDLLLLTNNAQHANVSEYHAYEHHPPFPNFPRPRKHQAAGLCHTSRQLRDETLRRSSSLRLGLRYTLRVVAHRWDCSCGLSYEPPRLRWIDTPIINGTTIDRLDVQFELNDLTSRESLDVVYEYCGIVGALLKNANWVLMYGWRRNPFKRTINKLNIEVTARKSGVMGQNNAKAECENAFEIFKKRLSEWEQDCTIFYRSAIENMTLSDL